jgi:ribonucleotide reductase beta subunit family protein with ferritin-like domain
MENILLTKSDNRLVLFPVQDADVWRLYKKAVANNWTVEEVATHLTQDLTDWEKLTKDEQFFIKRVLAFFAVSEGVVIENLAERFLIDVQLPEARAFYAFQIAMENVHSEMYSLLIDTYITDKKEQNELLQAMKTIPSIADKSNWGCTWIKSNGSFAERVLAFSIIEGVFFSGSFCAIFWLKKSNKMVHGLGLSNQMISRDEGLHTDFACLLYKKYCTKLSDKLVHQIMSEAVEIEKKFVTSSLPVDLIGMNSKLMSQYICFVADRLLIALGHSKLYNVVNPFDWMEKICMDSKTNFFEHGVSEYRRFGVQTEGVDGKQVIKESGVQFDKVLNTSEIDF